ncbi:MAG TPA: helix-turn-helix domain-containing protein [Bdellovibrionota bacterium]|nr:helix-turn-helix domain-containing protein [Bdellovibrionota bacterium]
MKRGRPKGRSRDRRSFGPLGDLIRKNRLDNGYGLLDVAKACECSVQFVSNMEHGRAPLPWEKVSQLAAVLKIPVEELQAANLAIRSDFNSFVRTSKGKQPKATPSNKGSGTASAVAFVACAAKDEQLRQVIQRYQIATPEIRKRFVRAAMQIL